MPIEIFSWSEQAYRAGLQEKAAYLVRPNGYIVVASPDQNPHIMQAFITRHQLQFA